MAPPFGINLAPRSSDPIMYGKQIATMVRDRVNFSREESVSLRRSYNRFYDLYRGYVRARTQPFRNQVTLPLLFSSIETGVAIKHGLLTAQKPLVEFIQNSPDQAPAARRLTALVQQQMEDAGMEEKLETILRMGDITGICPYQWSWKYVKNTRPTRTPNPADPTGVAFQVLMQETVDFDGPWVDIVDVLDFFPEPSKPTVQEMRWIARRYWMDFDDVQALAYGPNAIYDAAAVEELRSTQIGDEAVGEFENRRAAPGGLRYASPNIQSMDRYAKPVEIVEFHGIVPNELVGDDGYTNRLITVGNGTVTMRNVANPIWSGGLPFGVYTPTKDPYSVYGIGKIEPNDKAQAAANRYASQIMDAIDIVIDPVLFYNQLSNVRTDKLYTKAGAFIGGDGPPAEWVMAMHPDLAGLSAGWQEIERLWRWIQHGTGITEEAIGMPAGGGGGSDRQTAREFLGRMENVQRRMVREALSAAKSILIPIAEAFRAMDSQFLTFPRAIRMLGQSAIIDPATGQMIPPDAMITLQDSILHYDMRASSATSLVGRSAKQQNLTILLQAISAGPMAMITNWPAFARIMYTEFEISNPEDLILPVNPQELQLRMMAQQMVAGNKQQGSGEPRQDIAGTPDNVNNDLMDQMVQPTSPQNNPMGAQ